MTIRGCGSGNTFEEPGRAADGKMMVWEIDRFEKGRLGRS